MTAPTTKQVRNWAMLYDIRIDGKPVGLRGIVHTSIWAQHAAANGGKPVLTDSNEVVAVSLPKAETKTVTDAVAAHNDKMPKLGAGQGRYLRADKLTDTDIYLMTTGKEWHVMDADVVDGRMIAQMMNDDQVATVKFDASEMLRVL